MSETVAGFFSGGGRSAKFPTPGSKVEGVITKVHPPEQQVDFESRQPLPGKYQIRIELQTEERDPDIDGDDGARVLYIKGWMQGAVGDALRTAGVKEPEVGGKLVVTYTQDGPPTRPGLQGPKQYSAVYTAPGSGTFFMAGDGHNQSVSMPNGGKQDAPIPDAPPAGIDPEAWKVMPEQAKQAIANVAAGAK